VGFNPNFDPTIWGFDATSTNTLQIQIFTEFYNPPQPTMVMQPLYIEANQDKRATMASPDFIDYRLDFGDYVFGLGRAYVFGTNAPLGSGVTVAKDFVSTNGRSFLVESIPYRSIEGGLRRLPPVEGRTSMLRLRRAGRSRIAALTVPAPKNLRPISTRTMASARLAPLATRRPRGVDIDYVVTISSSAPTVYSSDTTYFVSGTVHNTSAVTMESAVFKYPTNTSGSIEISGPLTLATTNYRPAIFTAADDNTAGTSVNTTVWSNYTGNPSGKCYGNVALWLNTTANIALNDLRFCYARMAIEISADVANQAFTLSHSELVDCINGIYVSGGNGSGSGSGSTDSLTVNANNCLMSHVEYPLQTTSIIVGGAARNCTVDNSIYLLQFDPNTTGSFNFTNCILSAISSEGILGSVTVQGGYNGFYSATHFGNQWVSTTNNPYESVGAGNYYLSPSNLLYTNGTTNVGGPLLAQLKAKTTQPPLVLTNAFGANTNLGPAVLRDTNGCIPGW